MQIDKGIVAAARLGHLRMGGDEGDAVDFIVHELPLLNQLVRPQAIAVIGSENDEGVVGQPLRRQVIHNPAYHIID